MLITIMPLRLGTVPHSNPILFRLHFGTSILGSIRLGGEGDLVFCYAQWQLRVL